MKVDYLINNKKINVVFFKITSKYCTIHLTQIKTFFHEIETPFISVK